MSDVNNVVFEALLGNSDDAAQLLATVMQHPLLITEVQALLDEGSDPEHLPHGGLDLHQKVSQALSYAFDICRTNPKVTGYREIPPPYKPRVIGTE